MSDLIIGAIITIIKEMPAWIAELERRGELTPEQAQARRDEMAAAFDSPAWQPDQPPPTA